MVTGETERLSALIGDIYDVALDPALWPDALAKIAGFVGGQSAGLFSKDSVNKAANAYYTFGCDPRYLQLSLGNSWRFDPFASLPLFDVAQVVSTDNFMPYDEYRETPFHREWARPQGLVDSASAVLDKSATGFAFLSVLRNEANGRVDDAARRRLGFVVPHVRRAVLIGKTIGLRQAEAAAFADALDGLSAGMLFVNSSGRITCTNAAGRAMIAYGNVLRASHDRLLANDPDVNRALEDILLAASAGDAAIGARGVAVPLIARDGERYVAHVLPLSSGARRGAGMRYAATAALFVQKAALATRSPLEVIAQTYRVTPMELRVLLAIVEVGGVPQVAETLGIGESTVKTHLKRLYEKTGACRQADLVKLLAGYTGPLLG
jgi:DNA-binding CsgD family transcriptional regulator